MPILVGIDGTDDSWLFTPGRARRYDVTFAHSFVRQICTGRGLYMRGPVVDGRGLGAAVSAGVSYVEEALSRTPDEPILLTGYSRGAAGAVVIAKRLERRAIRVQAMMLFDTVDMHATLGAYVTPTNVSRVHHVMRHPATSSRESFGNAATTWTRPPTDYTQAFYGCTHGGMGGCPWPLPDDAAARRITKRHHIVEGGRDGDTNVSYERDERVSAQIWRDVQPFLREQGFFHTGTTGRRAGGGRGGGYGGGW